MELIVKNWVYQDKGRAPSYLRSLQFDTLDVECAAADEPNRFVTRLVFTDTANRKAYTIEIVNEWVDDKPVGLGEYKAAVMNCLNDFFNDKVKYGGPMAIDGSPRFWTKGLFFHIISITYTEQHIIFADDEPRRV